MEVAETGCINLRGLYPIVECRYTIAAAAAVPKHGKRIKGVVKPPLRKMYDTVIKSKDFCISDAFKNLQ